MDDVRGGVLDKQSCIEARRLEMHLFRKMGVYRKMKRADLPSRAKVITTKWVDTNKGSDTEPNYRSRLVGREIKTEERPDLFAATPPLESLRYVLTHSLDIGLKRYLFLRTPANSIQDTHQRVEI